MNNHNAPLAFPLRNLFLVTYATDVSWAAAMAGNVRESILAEAAAVEEGNGGDGERDVANGMATLSVTVRTTFLFAVGGFKRGWDSAFETMSNPFFRTCLSS